MVKVTVYIPSYNYGRYLDQAVQSVFNQTMGDWELIIIDDGSTDNTSELLQKYKQHRRTRIIEQENKGLNVTNNIALRLANGSYLMRLDADDYLDENALLILSNILDTKPEVGLVYPDYYEVDADGEVLHLVRRKKIAVEVELLDLPAHGACTMLRKELLMQIGGYIESFSCQDGYELWLRFIERFNPYNVNVPLFYYRQHPSSLTSKQKKILETRRHIKEQFVKKNRSGGILRVLGVIPVTRNSVYSQNDPFIELGGKPLLWYTLESLKNCRLLDRVVVSSEDEEVLEYSSKFRGVETKRRKGGFNNSRLKMKDLLRKLLEQMAAEENYVCEAVCSLYINTPLRKGHHIDKAINTMMIFDVDSVVSVQQELSHCYHHGRYGLETINNPDDGMRIERKGIYKENSAIYLSRTDVIRSGRLTGERNGHIIMLPEESIKINSAFDLWLVEKILTEWQEV